MKARKTIFVLSVVLLLTLMLGVGAGFYYFTHPPEVKALVEKAVSRATGASFSIAHLAYSLSPIRITAKGVVFEPPGGAGGYSIKVRDFMAECVLDGSFGRKTLVCSSLRVNGFECRVWEGATAGSSGPESREPSFFSSAVRALGSFFLFKEFKLQAGEIREGVLNARWGGRRIQLSGLSGHLNADHLVDIRGGILVEWPTENATLSIPDFHVETMAISLAEPKIAFTLAFPGGVLKRPEVQVKNIRARAAIHYDHRKQKMAFTGLKLILGEVRLKRLPQTEKAPLEVSLETAGEIDLGKKWARAHGLSLNVSRLLQFEGSLDAGFGRQPDFRVRIKEGRAFSQELRSLLPKDVGGKFGDCSISGPLDFSGTFSGEVKQGKWALKCNMVGKIKNSPVSYRRENMNVKGRMGVQVAVEGPISNLRFSGKVKAEHAAFQGMGLSATSASGALMFSGTYPSFNIKDLSCRIPNVKSLMRKRTFSVDRIEIDASKGQANVLTQTLSFPEIRINSSLLKNLFAVIQMDNGKLTLAAKGKQTELSRGLMALKLLPSGWTVQGTDTVEIEAVVGKKGGISFSSKLALEKFAFQNPQETCVGENISLRAHVSGRMTFPDLTVNVVAAIEADKGEVLLDRFYFDLKETGFFARCNGTYNGPRERVMLDGLSLGMKKIATAHVTGTLIQMKNGYEGELSLKIPDTPIKEPFHRLVLEPFQTEKPVLAAVKLDGVFSAKMTLKGNPYHWMTKGVCTWKDGSLSYGDSVATFTGIDLSLPIWLTNGEDDVQGQNLEGGLSVRSMRVSFLPEQGLNIPIKAASNRLFMPIATALEVPGGRIRIGPSKIARRVGLSPVIDTALHFDALQMEPMLKGIWPHSVKGTAACDLDPIHIEGGNLKSAGEIKANVFGGALILSQVGARGLFTALPVFSLNANWHGLNLAEMTQDTSFGKIEGVLDGYAKKFEVSNGQLQRFDLLLDTVKTDGVPQKISVKAVDNIARLGGGQSPFIGVAGMFVSLFREFPYRKIGVHATLENDIFRIHGAIRDGDKEYLVKRGFFSGVDVINQSKDNRVSFKDMLKRMKRVTDAKGGPVVR